MKPARLSVVILSAAAVIGLLAGCGTPAPQPSSGATTPPSTSAAPTPTATPAADPEVRVPLACADLFSTADVSALVASPVTVRRDETSSPDDVTTIAQRQRGVLNCWWGGKNRTDSSYDQSLQVFIAPDAATDYAAKIDAAMAEGETATKNTAGDASAYVCQSYGGFTCYGNMLVGTYWVSVWTQRLDSTPKIPAATVKKRMQKVLTGLATTVGAAGEAGPAWAAPAGGLLPFCSEPKQKTATVRKAFTSAGLVLASGQDVTAYDASTLGLDGTHSFCSWEQKVTSAGNPAGQVGDVSLHILDGGAWALPSLVANPPEQYYVGQYAPVTIPGTTGGILACNNADCEAILGIGTNAVEVDFTYRGTAKDTASLTAIAASIAAG